MDVERELDERTKNLATIRREFRGRDYDPASNLVAHLRIAGERFWSGFLSPQVWTKVERQSASELVDAFSTEYLLRQSVLSTWSTVALALCKVIERETSRAIFSPWKKHFLEAAWAQPPAKSKRERNRINIRLTTFKTLKSCSSEKGHPPTLGQLVFIAKFWNDPLMDQCTDLFKGIRSQATRYSPDFSEKVSQLARILEKPLTTDSIAMTIPEARNRSAHPREAEDVEWPSFIEHLRETLGKPPVELLKLVLELVEISKFAQSK